MSNEDCKQRFKGVENFLRRVAFNLGNTPSQTEVKVISCIPIDVSDLQQKIIDLEKQLVAANCKVISTSQVHINTVICNTSFPKISNVANSSKAINCPQSCSSIHCPNSPVEEEETISTIAPTGPCEADCFISSDLSDMAYLKKRRPTEGRKKFFNKRKDSQKKKMRTHLVYYAQTESKTPFNQYRLPADDTSKNRGNDSGNAFERSYLSDMVRKQYKPGAGNVDLGVSEFSTPICRDFIRAQKVLDVQSHASDMCSCCHGPFRNIDNHMSKHNHYDVYSSQTESKNTYYDSKYYDVVPVKENSAKIKNIDFPKRKEPKYLNKKQMDIGCWPGRPRCRDMPPIIVNYNTTVPARQLITKMTDKTKRKEKVLSKNIKYQHKKPVHSIPVNLLGEKKVSQTHSVEFSEVYTRRVEKPRLKIIVPKATPAPDKNLNDAACLTTTIANTECQTASDINAISPENTNTDAINTTVSEDKTKVTLNQIKDILQSVLTEVKTNSKICNISSQTKKKDAVVQNGLSQSNMFGRSSLLQTFTYSPYEMDPYGPSCSQQIQTSNLCYPNLPLGSAKCMQHYPLFVQPGRNMCTSCYNPNKNNPTVSKLPSMKRAASTATNTEELRTRSKETENLIREIYKAMALNIDIATDTPVKEHGDTNNTIHNYNTVSEDRESNHLANAISEIFKNTNPMETSATQNTPFDSNLAFNETNFRCHPERSYAREHAKYYDSEVRSDNETEQVSQQLESDEESETTAVNEETESSVSETESEPESDVMLSIKEPSKKQEKKGLFSKMLKLFTPRSRNKKYKESQTANSDSVDYRMIHRNKAVAPKSVIKPSKSKTRAVVYYSKKPQKHRNHTEPPQHSPYMEQEYRRHFDEKLMFHHTHEPKSSTRNQATPPRKKPIYYQKVEMRTALVDHYQHQNENRQNYPRTETKSIKNYSNRSTQKQDNNSPNSGPDDRASTVPGKAKRWLEKHKLGIRCGKQWKKLILES